jgi:hypothetical protein
VRAFKRDAIWDGAWLFLLYGWTVIFSYPYFFRSAAQNIRQIQTYNLDSADGLRAVERGLQAPLFRLTFNDYGHFYYNLTLAVFWIYSHVGSASERALFFVLRMNSLIGGCLSIAITYIFAKRYLDRPSAIVASGLMALSPALLQYSNEVKPDSWQVFFLMLSIYFLARGWEKCGSSAAVPYLPSAELWFVVAASAAAGAAFGTKYLGMFMLPLIGVAMLGVDPGQVSNRLACRFKKAVLAVSLPLALFFAVLAVMGTPERVVAPYLLASSEAGMSSFLAALLVVRIVCVLAALALLVPVATRALRIRIEVPDRVTKEAVVISAVAGAFWLAFFISSPWLLYRLDFVRQIFIRNGLMQNADRFGWRWLPELFWSGTYVGYCAAILALGGLFWLGVSVCRNDWKPVNRAFLPVWGFMGIFVWLLVAKVNRATVLYGLPIIPLLALLAAYAVWKAASFLAKRFRSRSAVVTAALGIILLAEQVWESGAKLMAYPNLVTQITPENRRLSTWLLKCVPATNRVLAGSYSYIPPDFATVEMGDGFLYFAQINPSVVVLNMKTRFETERDTQTYPGGGIDPDRAKLYRLLDDREQWSAGPLFGVFRVYLRRGLEPSSGCR